MTILMFRRHRLATLLIALTLTGGLGISIALVTLVDALMWRGPQGVVNPQRLFVSSGSSNYVEFQTLSANMQSAHLAAVSRVDLTIGSGEAVAEMSFECVTASYFDILGVRPQRGRAFTPGSGEEANAIIDAGLWRRMGRPELPTPLLVDGRTYSVIGVMPYGFGGFRLPPVAGWLSLEAAPETCSFSGTNLLRSSDSWWLDLVGRLAPTVSLAHANAEIVNALQGSRVEGLEDRQPQLIQPLMTAQSQVIGLATRTAWWVAAGAVALVAVVVLNVSSLYGLLWLRRRQDVAVRLVLGADRWWVAARSLLEMAMVVAVCLPIALIVAGGLTAALQEYFPISASSIFWSLRSVLIAFGMAALVAICASVAPILNVFHTDTAIVHGAGFLVTEAPTSRRLRTTVVVMQIALAIGLTIVAHMFATSVGWLGRESGYEIDELALIEPRLIPFGDSNHGAALELSEDQLNGLPAIASTTLGTGVLLDLDTAVRKTTVGRQAVATNVAVFLNIIAPHYFATVGTRLLSGRDFDASDHGGNEPVGILSRVTAQKLWPSGDALGSCLRVGQSPCVRIIGISEPRRAWRLTSATDELFLPASQFATIDRSWSPTSLLVRTVGPARQNLQAIQQVIGSVADKGRLRVSAVSELAGIQVKAWRVGAALFSLFSWAALLLSALGVYATFALYVRERTTELAVRMACGAGPKQLARLLVRRCLIMTISGIAIGSVIAYGSTLAARSMWFGTAPGDPSAFGFAAGVVGVAAAVGIMAPTVVAIRLNPSALSRVV